MAVCLVHIEGSCRSYPFAPMWGWFDDHDKGGASTPSRADCYRRAHSWAADCGSSALITIWFRGQGKKALSGERIRKMGAPPPACLSHEPPADCPIPGHWPTLVHVTCPHNYTWAAMGVCYSGASWGCPEGSTQLQRPPFCASNAAQSMARLVPILRCYVERYTDLRKTFCANKGGETSKCQWRKVVTHYQTYGRKESRNLLCETKRNPEGNGRQGSTTRPGYSADERFPNVALSAPTAKALANRAVRPGPDGALWQEQERPSCSELRPCGSRALMTFSVCGGLVNQRLAIVEALMIGHILDATVVLPSLNLNGRQTGEKYTETEATLAPFTAFFDGAASQEALLPYVRTMMDEGAQAFTNISTDVVQGRNLGPGWYERLLQGRQRSSLVSPPRLRFGCTLMSLDKRNSRAAEKLFWSIDAALVPAAEILWRAQETTARLQASANMLGGGGRFTALHLRVETDWVEHCKRWESSTSDPPRDNCLSNTDILHRVFTIEGVDSRHPLYVATEQSSKLNETRGLHDLTDYRMESRTTIWQDRSALHREIGAFHDLLICMAAHRFVGNSVSTCALCALATAIVKNARLPFLALPVQFRHTWRCDEGN